MDDCCVSAEAALPDELRHHAMDGQQQAQMPACVQSVMQKLVSGCYIKCVRLFAEASRSVQTESGDLSGYGA